MTNSRTKGDLLIGQLLVAPGVFNGNELLNEYFKGYPLATLRPLLSSTNKEVRRIAVWLVSELGSRGEFLMDAVQKLLNAEDDRYIRFYALDMIAACCAATKPVPYHALVRSLEDPDQCIRGHAMFLISNADQHLLEATLESNPDFHPSTQQHIEGLTLLTTPHVSAAEIMKNLNAARPLIRRYAAIAAWRSRATSPDLLPRLAAASDDDIQAFVRERGIK